MKLIVEHYKECTNKHFAIVLMAGSNVIKTVIEVSQNIHTYIHTYIDRASTLVSYLACSYTIAEGAL